MSRYIDGRGGVESDSGIKVLTDIILTNLNKLRTFELESFCIIELAHGERKPV